MAEKGKVKFYDWKKGFGFVTTEGGEDLFLHRTGIPKGTKIFTEDVVEFDVIDGPKGKNATNLKVIESNGPTNDAAPTTEEEKDAPVAEEPVEEEKASETEEEK